MMIKCLASEEPDVTVMAVKPGIVETDMAASVLTKGEGHVDPSKTSFLRTATKLKPEEPAKVLAELVLEAPKEYSGKFFSFTEYPK
jgi:NAD(P)-dependent dehydrogenase (short-subunit alcohol dehydrogenase family)